MNSYLIKAGTRILNGDIHLSGSKSIANRALLIRALSGQSFVIDNLSDSDDTNTLHGLLNDASSEILDCGHAGTTFRFLTAYLALKDREVVITGSERMQKRPIGPLVEALNLIGADITYEAEEGFPPLRIKPYQQERHLSAITISAGISSQYISALLMIAPTLPKGLTIKLEGDVVSRPYIDMTLRIMHYFGIIYKWRDHATIDIPAQTYSAKDFVVESDWSAASYYFILAALADSADIRLSVLYADSLQGDSAIVNMGRKLGLMVDFNNNTLIIHKDKTTKISFFEHNFVQQPDIAQSISVLCAGLGIQGLFSGLQTLRIKETDRIAALQVELAKVSVILYKMPVKFSPKSGIEYYMQEGKALISDTPSFATYHDHRMAMSLAPLALLGDIKIEDPMVVTKSYPAFWQDMKSLGFLISEG